MAATKEFWERLIELVMQTYYEQCDDYIGFSFEEAKPFIQERLSLWRLPEFNAYVQEEVNHEALKALATTHL